MNNFIEYFYGIKLEKVMYNEKYYSFIHNNYIYRLYVYDDSLDINTIYDINRNVLKFTLMGEIILNKDNQIISRYNGISYVLIKFFVNINKPISLNEISLLADTIYYDNKKNVDWGKLWSNKIDYLESLINENGKKYPLIVDSFNYFVGMAENAISYFNSIELKYDYKFVISHRIIRWNDSIDVIYNPLNIILDYRIRDVSEYIKNSFFNNNRNIFNELYAYLDYHNLSLTEVKLLISRLLYPSFYFDLYEDILIDNREEKIIIEVISRLEQYEAYLFNVISFFKSRYDVDEIAWLKNTSK